MAAVHIRLSVNDIAAFALAWLALCASPGSAQQSRPPLVLLPINGGGTVVLVPQRDDGGFSDEDLQRAAVAFSQQSPGKVHPLAPRLLDLVYRSVRHFDAHVVRVVSGFRRDRAGSRHTQGRAVDMTIEGVANDRLAAYARDFGFVGVGCLPQERVRASRRTRRELFLGRRLGTGRRVSPRPRRAKRRRARPTPPPAPGARRRTCTSRTTAPRTPPLPRSTPRVRGSDKRPHATDPNRRRTPLVAPRRRFAAALLVAPRRRFAAALRRHRDRHRRARRVGARPAQRGE